MIRHIIVSGWRLLRSDLFFSVITVLSLAVGCTTALLVGAYVREELSFERWLPGAEQVARIETTVVRPGESPRESAYAPSGLSSVIAEGVDCIEAQTRMQAEWYTVQVGDQKYNHRISYVDPDVFKVFPLPAKFGDAEDALSEPSNVVLTARVAEKLFGDVNPVGRTLRLPPDAELRVAAVLEPLARTTHLEIDMLAPTTGVARRSDRRSAETNLTRANTLYYVRATPGTEEACFSSIVSIARATVQKRLDDGDDELRPKVEFFATPIVDIHLNDAKLNEYAAHGDANQLALFGAIALLILAVSAFNYVTMSLARSVTAAREVGLRKALGATPADVALHYLGGSFIFTGLAVLLGFSMAEMLLPWFALGIGRELTMGSLHHPEFLLAAVVGGVGLALAVGIYPAMYLARQPAATALKGRIAQGRGLAFVNQGLLLIQLATATVLLCFVFVMMAQARFVAEQPLGFDRANRMVLVGVNYGPTQTPQRFKTFKRLALASPDVRGVTAAGALPNWNFERRVTLSAPDLPLAPKTQVIYLDVGLDFFSTLEVRLLAGRTFGEDYARDRLLIEDPMAKADLLSVVVSRQTAQRLVGSDYESLVGKVVTINDAQRGPQKVEVVGVVEDLHYRSLRFAIEPMVFLPNTAAAQTYIVHFDAERREAASDSVEQSWDRAYPMHLMTSAYLDDQMAELYEEDRRVLHLIAGFGVLAVLLACLGLYGMSAFAAQRRTREIGIRKALGAEWSDILRLMIAAFVRPALIASVLALPFGLVVSHRWLSGFAVRTSLSPSWFIEAMLVVAAVATVAVLANAMRAAATAPAEALRYE